MSFVKPIFWTIFILLLIELTLEYRASIRGYDSLLFKPHSDPVLSRDRIDQTHDYGPTAEFPFRSRVISPEKDPGVRRVWIASASHAEDVRMPPDQIFPSLLESQLNKEGLPCQVINASQAGFRLSDNARMLESLGPDWQPEVVIVYQMSMDLVSNYKFNTGMLPIDPSPTHGLGNSFGKWMQRYLEKTTTYELLKGNLTVRLNEAASFASEAPRLDQTAFISEINDLANVCRRLGARMYVCTFAFSNPRGDFPREYVLALQKWAPGLSPNGWVVTIEDWNEAIRDGAKNFRVIELDRELSGSPSLFRDPVHFSAEGHRRVAKELGSFLRRDWLDTRVNFDSANPSDQLAQPRG